MTRTEALKMVRETNAIPDLLTNMGVLEVPEDSSPAAEAVNAAYWAIVGIMEKQLVDIIMVAQTETAEAAWKIVHPELDGIGTEATVRSKFEAAFPGVKLP